MAIADAACLQRAGKLGSTETAGKTKPLLWRWREGFMTKGVDGPTRNPGKPPMPAATAQRVVD